MLLQSSMINYMYSILDRCVPKTNSTHPSCLSQYTPNIKQFITLKEDLTIIQWISKD